MPYRVNTTTNDPCVQDDVLVEKLLENGEWKAVVTYNSLSDDYAFTNARRDVETLNKLESKCLDYIERHRPIQR